MSKLPRVSGRDAVSAFGRIGYEFDRQHRQDRYPLNNPGWGGAGGGKVEVAGRIEWV